MRWKPVQDYPNYEVSDTGLIRFLGGYRKFGTATRYAPPSIRKPLRHTGGYSMLRLKERNLYIHRLVAEAIIPHDPERRYVNHKNGDKTDNRVENLEWCTVQENQLHKTRVIRTGNIGSRMGRRISKVEYDAILVSSDGVKDLATRFGVSTTRIYRIKRGLCAATFG